MPRRLRSREIPDEVPERTQDEVAGRTPSISRQDLEALEERANKNVESVYLALQAQMQQVLQAVQGLGLPPSEPVQSREQEFTQPAPLDTNEINPAPNALKLKNVPGPENLQESASLAHFLDWKDKFENYILLQGLELVPPEKLNAVLYSFISQEVADVIRLVLKVPLRSDYKITLTKLEEYFKSKENGRTRRCLFSKRKQQEGESFGSFFREKVKLFQLTDPCKHCYDRTLADNVIESLRDEGTRRRCRTLPDSCTISDIVRICETEELARQEEERNSSQDVAKVTVTRKNKLCYRCNKQWHKFLQDCPALNHTCEKCQKKGHFGQCCKSKQPIRSVDVKKKCYTCCRLLEG